MENLQNDNNEKDFGKMLMKQAIEVLRDKNRELSEKLYYRQMSFRKKILVSFLCVLIGYALISFALLEFNPIEWQIGHRSVLIALSLGSFLIVFNYDNR